jgi:hypothetical protein
VKEKGVCPLSRWERVRVRGCIVTKTLPQSVKSVANSFGMVQKQGIQLAKLI